MDRLPEFNEDENLLKIKMDKNQTFVLVEGSFDVPIYDAALRSLIGNENEYEWDVVHGGCKDKILKFMSEVETDNFIAALDKDFSEGVSDDERAFLLKKYSIENYFFCEKVLSHSVSMILSLKYGDLLSLLSLNELKSHYSNELSYIYYLLREYQALSDSLEDEDNFSWSETFIIKNRGWGVELDKVEEIKSEVCRVLERFEVEVSGKPFLSDEILNLFPGKMLLEGVRRFVNEKLEALGERRPYQNVQQFKAHASSMLFISKEFVGDIRPAIEFVRGRGGVVST